MWDGVPPLFLYLLPLLPHRDGLSIAFLFAEFLQQQDLEKLDQLLDGDSADFRDFCCLYFLLFGFAHCSSQSRFRVRS